jgi:hypothetical protein
MRRSVVLGGKSFVLLLAFPVAGCGEPDVIEDVRASSLELHESGSLSDDGEGGINTVPLRASAREMTADDIAIKVLHRPDIGPSPTDPTVISNTARTLAAAESLPPSSMIKVSVELEDIPFNYHRFRNTSPVTRNALIEERKADIARSQEPLKAELTRMGVSRIMPLWLVNHVAVEIPARQLKAIAALPGVTGVSLDDDNLGPAGAYGGSTARSGTGIVTMINQQLNGKFWSRNGSTERVRLGVIEWNNVLSNHVGFTFGGGARIKKVTNCIVNPCAPMSAGSVGSHGTWVAWVAAGSIESNQSTTFPGFDTIAQRLRSGMSPRSDIYYYQTGDCNATARAVQQAVADGVDVINMSFDGANCPGLTTKCGSFDDALEAAANSGVLNVGGTGNEGSYSSINCNVSLPMYRTSTISANGLDTTDIQQAHSQTVLHDTSLFKCSAKGGVPIRTASGVSTTMSGIGFSAPAVYQHFFDAAPDTYGDTSAICGTSFASPTVAGMMANLRHALGTIGWPSNDARLVATVGYISGDAWTGAVAAPTARLKSGLSAFSGVGRLAVRWPSSASLATPWSWQWANPSIFNGGIVSYSINGGVAIPSSIQQVKLAVTWSEPDLSNVADIVLHVKNMCPAGGGTPVVVMSQTDFDLRKRIQLRGSDIVGKCLQLDISGWSVPAAGRQVYASFMYHGGVPF